MWRLGWNKPQSLFLIGILYFQLAQQLRAHAVATIRVWRATCGWCSGPRRARRPARARALLRRLGPHAADRRRRAAAAGPALQDAGGT